MTLRPRRPPGHGLRKALAYAADIQSLRKEGHTYQAIKEALEDAGVRVSIATVRREVLRRAPQIAGADAKSPNPAPAGGSRGEPAALPNAAVSPGSPKAATALPGRAMAEEFMRGQPTNPLHLKELAP